MKVTLRVLDGSLAGKEFDFDLQEGTEVRIGRHPVRCQLVLPPDYSTVSRQHCVLRSVLGRVRVRVNKENPVFVAGAPAWDESVVRDGAELRLGAQGPRLQMVIHNSESAVDLRATVAIAAGYVPPEQAVQEEAHRTAEELRGHRRKVWIGAMLLGAAAAVGLFVAIEAHVEAGKLVATTLTAAQRQSVLDLVGRSSQPKVDLGDVVRAASPSIYCVVDNDGTSVRPLGTAWVLDRDNGQVATNSHVAEEFVQGRMFLRSVGRQGEDIPIAAARQHPGYQRYTQLCEKFAGALMIDGGASSKTVVACDVALLQVPEEARARLAPALPVLDAKGFAQIRAGRACASVGFPAEGLAFNVDRPQSRSHLGHVIAVSDFFMAPASLEAAQLVHTDLPVNGGSSGSPVLDEDGRVLGIINAGSFTLGMEGRRIPIAGTTYAQRIDLLQELILDDKGAQSARELTWESAFLAMVDNAKKSLEQVLTERFRRVVAAGRDDVKVEVVVRGRSELAWDGKIAESDFAFQAPSSARYLFCAMSEDMEDIDAVALLPDGGRQVDTAADWYPCVVVSAQKDETVHFIVLRNVDKPVAATIFVLRALD
ncbi:MAG TPA: trypsin-like peptidase domain-containing protein [Planctomycetota bacterium]|nr:trypsin-like peptidase domain-containing protein [Planctomycetota bacterium]